MDAIDPFTFRFTLGLAILAVTLGVWAFLRFGCEP